MINLRAEAALIIDDILGHRCNLSTALSSLDKTKYSAQDLSFLKALCFESLRWYPRHAEWLKNLMPKPLAKKERVLQALLCIGLTQLFHMQVSAHAAVHETVEGLGALKKPWAKALVNAVLREAQRKAHQLEALENLTARFAHPMWLIEAYQSAWPDVWDSLLAANNFKAPLILRVNARLSTVAQMLEQLPIEAQAVSIPELPQAIVCQNAFDIVTHPAYHAGLFSVQDGAGQWAAPLLQLAPKMRVLDACAAPGGKTAHMLELEPQLREVLALDLEAPRLARMRTNLQRLKLSAKLSRQDASRTEDWWDGTLFDRILLDAPCSGTGVIRRHPDIKLLRKPEDLRRLVEQQHALLQALWPLLKPNGLMLYATCSVLPQENEHQIIRFLQSQADAQLHSLKLTYPQHSQHGHQILPGCAYLDGFYYALLQKLPL